MGEMVGNVTFVSNLYPVDKDYLVDDINYCQHIEDPKRLFEMKCNLRFRYFNFTKLQGIIFCRESGINCKINKEDKPMGAILDKDGLVREICKCKHTDCKYYNQCKNCSV